MPASDLPRVSATIEGPVAMTMRITFELEAWEQIVKALDAGRKAEGWTRAGTILANEIRSRVAALKARVESIDKAAGK